MSAKDYEEEFDNEEEEDDQADDQSEEDDEDSEDEKPKKKRVVKKKETKKRKTKGPKKAQSAYMFFANARRGEEKAKNPELAFADLAKRLGALWKALTPEEKKPYDEMAAKDKLRFQQEKDNAPEEDSDDDAPKAKRAKKDPNAPKKPLNAYMFFAQEHRSTVLASHPGLRASEVTKKLGEMWKTVSPDDKKRFEEQSANDKIRYQKAMDAYQGK